jgi:hypothetical protein
MLTSLASCHPLLEGHHEIMSLVFGGRMRLSWGNRVTVQVVEAPRTEGALVQLQLPQRQISTPVQRPELQDLSGKALGYINKGYTGAWSRTACSRDGNEKLLILSQIHLMMLKDVPSRLTGNQYSLLPPLRSSAVYSSARSAKLGEELKSLHSALYRMFRLDWVRLSRIGMPLCSFRLDHCRVVPGPRSKRCFVPFLKPVAIITTGAGSSS